MLIRSALLLTACLFALPAQAENREYGDVWLSGLARDSWPLNPQSTTSLAMVCNVNGPDGFLSIRSGPAPDFKALRKLNRLAIVQVDKTERRGNWIRVITAYRDTDKNGRSIENKSLHVQGWAHDGYLCDFVH